MWPHVRHHIDRALRRGRAERYAVSDILELLLQGKARLWVVWNGVTKTADAAIVTEMIDYPRVRELHIWLIGGSRLGEWGTRARDMLEEYARSQGCGLVAGGMRRGWLKIGGDAYYETGVTFERVL